MLCRVVCIRAAGHIYSAYAQLLPASLPLHILCLGLTHQPLAPSSLPPSIMRNIEFRTWYRNQPLGDSNEAESVRACLSAARLLRASPWTPQLLLASDCRAAACACCQTSTCAHASALGTVAYQTQLQ